MPDVVKSNLGPVTAYADAVKHGYTGSREDFGNLLAGAGKNLIDAVAAKDAAQKAATDAASSKQSAADSLQGAQTAQSAAEKAVEDASAAKNAAETAKAGAEAAQTAAGEQATAAAASATAAENSNTAAKNSADAAAASSKSASDTAGSIKDSLDQIAENKAGVSQLKEATSALKDGKISKFYASSQGNTNLPDSDDGRIMDLKLYGKSSQQQYAGRNLWSGKNLESYWMGDGETVNSDCVNSDFIPVDGAKTIYVGFSYDWAVGYSCYDSNKNRIDGSSLQINSTTSGTEKAYEIRASANKTPENTAYIKLMYSKHEQKPYVSVAEGAYEPYVGGIPSPNPEYPQEIKSVVNPVVKVTGKNLLKTIDWETQTVSGVTIEKTSDTVFKISGTATGEVVFNSSWGQGINVPAQSYLLCKILHGSCPAGSKVTFFTANYDAIASEIGEISPLRTSAISCGLVRFAIKKGSNINCTVGLSIQMDTSTDYEPYTEQTAALPYTLNAIPVTSGNVTIDGQQYVADYVDVERGKLVRMVGKLTIDAAQISSDANWYNAEKSYSYEINQGSIKPSIKNGGTIVSDGVTGYGFNDFYSKGVETGILSDQPFVVVNISKSLNICTSVDEFIAWFNKSNTIGILAIPTETDLTADEIAAFKALASHYPVTNVSTTSDQLGGYTVFNYPISLANGWNYVKQQLGDTRDYLYGIDLMTAEAYVNSEYAAALAEIEV